MRALRHREIKPLAQAHPAERWQRRVSDCSPCPPGLAMTSDSEHAGWGQGQPCVASGALSTIVTDSHC